MDRFSSFKLFLGICVLLLGLSCSKDSENPVFKEDVLTVEEELFLEEYEYVTFKLDPNSSGAPLSEKWEVDIKIFLDGEISPEYRAEVGAAILNYNEFFKNGISCVLVDTVSESNVRLVLGEKEAVEMLWPDMYGIIDEGNFIGYALYNYNGNYNIINGRIWVSNTGIPIFTHELGHVLGLGHASSTFCDSNTTDTKSFMCSSLSNGFSDFDKGILRTLYHPSVEVGKSFQGLRPVIEDLLLSNKIVL
ncbi:MAG: hypothetical protein WBB27_00905 [Maribacter sp.]